MKSREREVVLGAVVFLAIVIAVGGALWLSERYAGAAGGYQLRVIFDSVPGLQRGNAVTVRGVKVGKVLGIELQDGRPVVTLGFEGHQSLPRNSRILLKSEGLLGGQMIEVQPGSAAAGAYEDGEVIRGETVGGIEQVTASASRIASQLNQALEQALSERNLEHMQSVLRDLDGAARQVRQILEENRETVDGLLDTLALTSGQAREMLKENRPDLRRTVENLKQSSERLATTSEHLQTATVSLAETLENLREVTGKVRGGEGTLGRLVYDDTAYQNLERTLASLDSLVQAVKRDPTRYLNFDLHLF